MNLLLFSLVILNCLNFLRCICARPNRPRPTEYKGAADLNHEDDESPYPIYPFQQYVQVRKSYSVEHLPSYSYSNVPEDSHQHSASNLASATGENVDYETKDGNHYKIPILTEEIEKHDKHEVYEEKGYSDSDYDHQHYGQHNHNHHESPGKHHTAATSNYNRPQQTLHDSDGTSTKLLEHAANNFYDAAAHEKGIYQAREDIYCPEVIDFDLNSKKMAMGQGGDRPRGAKPRLKGLGSKIACLKNKYFGREPLPKEIFQDPSESRHSTINLPNFNQFLQSMKKGIHADSSFQF